MDLSGFQREELTNPIQVVDSEETTVEGALNALNEKKANIFYGTEDEYEALSLAERKQYEYLANDNGEAGAKDVYSTTETKTNKVWIDGKPIYRKVFSVATHTFNSFLKLTIVNVDSVCSYEGTYEKSTTTDTYKIEHWDSTDPDIVKMLVQRASNQIVVGPDTGGLVANNIIIILEYTKAD